MPAPKNPNTAAATAAVRRRGQETMAAKLRAAGWAVTPPEDVHHSVCDRPDALHAEIAGIRTHLDSGAPCEVQQSPVCSSRKRDDPALVEDDYERRAGG